jgi:hypothetical protein
MNPAVIAAIIAASVSVLTLIGTLVAQFYGIRKTSSDTEKTLKSQSEQLDRTLAEQREHLDRTLAEQRTRTLNERFATAAGQLGSDKPPAVRRAGVYAMAGLADDWEENRQTCVDVLCAYLRMPYEPDPGQDVPGPQRLDFQASREVRHTVIRVITAHLKDDAALPWRGLNFDFTGVVFDGGDFGGATFSGGMVDFAGTTFSGHVYFGDAEFSGASVSFGGATFSGEVYFGRAKFSGGNVYFNSAKFSGGKVHFTYAEFSGSMVFFSDARFSGGAVSFGVSTFSGGIVRFDIADFSSGTVDFGYAEFSGGTVDFNTAKFSGGTVDFSDARDWSFPPEFPWADKPPRGVKLPHKEGQSQA